MNATAPSDLTEHPDAETEERWTAVINRDPAADGRFVYSVRTTGVYCRPSCPSRPALRANVRFHDSCEAAEAAGFRACKRCRPNNNAEPVAAKIALACRQIERADESPSLNELAQAAGLSPYHFQRTFKRIVGVTPKEYARARRADRARAALRERDTVTEAIYTAGYQSNGRFYAESTRELGMRPKRFRDGGDGETIRFAIGECSLGPILVAASDKGVCAVFLGDDPEALATELQNRFRKARLIGGDRAFEGTVATVVGFVESPQVGWQLPLDIRGTAFQRRVWNALQTIPIGSTASYAEIARRLNAPNAVRAVAGACAANSIAVAIPCHRVVRTDGGLSGYRWGVERKRKLLLREQAAGAEQDRRTKARSRKDFEPL